MRQNNIPHNTGHLTSLSSRSVAGQQIYADACALGQCAINLGVTPSSLQDALHAITIKGEAVHQSLDSFIVNLNDHYKYSPDKTAKDVLKLLTPEQLAQVIEVETEFSIVVLKTS